MIKRIVLYLIPAALFIALASANFAMYSGIKNKDPGQSALQIITYIKQKREMLMNEKSGKLLSSTKKNEQVSRNIPLTKKKQSKESQDELRQEFQDTIKKCFSTHTSAACLDSFFKEFLGRVKVKDTLSFLDALQTVDASVRSSCHEITHSIGRETFQKTGTVSQAFNECNQTCHSGCYHGAMERFLRGGDGDLYGKESRAHISETEIKEKITLACNPNDPVNFKFQCLHGLGHAIIYFLNYNLLKGLTWCDLLPTAWDQQSCYGGAFMENVTALDKSKRFLSKTDPHFPCSVVEDRYKSDCYVMQTSRMFEMGLGDERVIEECKKAGNWRWRCIQSLGRDKSNEARLNSPEQVSRLCAGLETESDRSACMQGVAYALADNTWDGRYVFPFCESYEDAGITQSCYQMSISYLGASLVVQSPALKESCQKYVPDSQYCLQAVKESPF